MNFEVATGPPVQMVLVPTRELQALGRGRDYDYVVKMAPQRSGTFTQLLPEKGDYDIVLVDDEDAPAMVRLHAAIEYARAPVAPTALSPARKWTVIAISLLVFGLALGWPARKMMAAMRR